MGGGESENEEDLGELPPCLAGVRLVDAPVLFFVVSHKAFRDEIASLLHLAVEAAASEAYDHGLVVDLGRRFEFLRLVYKYHCIAEDEVIFLALDAQVKNVAPTYTLEHKSIDDKFRSIFYCLDLLMNENEETPEAFQELILCISTILEIISQHMLKEEKQVFPLLVQIFSSTEQAELVWRYMCSVPIILLEEFLPWITSSLTSNEKLDVISCMEFVVPKERLLQEVIVSWLGNHKRSYFEGCSNYAKETQFYSELPTLGDRPYKSKVHSGEQQQQTKASLICKNEGQNPIEGICIWHAAIRRDFNDILEELHQIRSSSSFSSLASVMTQLRFIADVIIFYSISLDQFFYPMPRELTKNGQSTSSQLIDQSQIEDLQKLLFDELQGTTQLISFVEILCEKMESFFRGFSENLSSLEAEVFPIIAKTCSSELQLWLLYTSLHKMPLGLLRCAVTWFSTHLTENESNSLLRNIELGCPVAKNSFALLLHEWVHIGSSGKTSVEKFRQRLEELFRGRSYYLNLTEQVKQDTALAPLKIQFPSKYNSELRALWSAMVMKKSEANPSYSNFNTSEKHDLSYSGVINLKVFYPQPLKQVSPIQQHLAADNSSDLLTLESRPMDHVLFIHRALIKDMEYLVSLSAKLNANVGLLDEFRNRFHLLQNMYRTHSNTEDTVTFPVLESRKTLENISHSYSMDHNLEVRQFRKVSLILNEISKLHLDLESDQVRPKHHQLCLKLHDKCIAMLKVLSDHIYREEVEIFPLFRKFFSIEEQEKMVEDMLGSTSAEYLQEMIPWLMAYLTPNEQKAVTSLWCKVAKNTKFDEWLREWWDGLKRCDVANLEEEPKSSSVAADLMEVVSSYLLKERTNSQKYWPDQGTEVLQKDFDVYNSEHSEPLNEDKATLGGRDRCQSQNSTQYHSKVGKRTDKDTNDPSPDVVPVKLLGSGETLSHQEHPLIRNQEELEATIRRVSRDSTLDSQMKAHIIQNLLMSRWMVTQQISHQESAVAIEGEIRGQSPSYRGPHKLAFGCKHYKRNCKILAPCCNKLYTCLRCHDEETDHSIDRKAVTKMLCMKCLVIQPIAPKCSTLSCDGFLMGRYYCRICKLFDDDRQIYHCPYCNLCRLGKGLGIDYFHCMKCNACMSRSLFVHACREKCLEDNCPICHEFIFTSNSPVKALPCGHLMHSACFQDYTCMHYTCPICSKSLGDMQVYFEMLDALLAEEKIPEEYSGQIQAILCNDCEKRGTAAFHWLYHKCSDCGSYNTRLL